MLAIDFGTIKPPAGTFLETSAESGGVIQFISNLLNLIIVFAGLFALINFILAGYGYLGATNDPQKTVNAGNKILHSIIGLAIIGTSFVLAAVIGQLLFKDPTALIKPTFFGIE